MDLERYRAKRDFGRTPEPSGRRIRFSAPPPSRRFVIQKHQASHLHYDLRLESGGVLKSWAVPKGPSMEPGKKRLAVMVEDHPLEYRTFEGVIPEGYGAGTVMIWDEGTYVPLPKAGSGKSVSDDDFVDEAIEKGSLHFRLSGKRLNGEFRLFRIGGEKKNWLLVKADVPDTAAHKEERSDKPAASGGIPKKIAGREEPVDLAGGRKSEILHRVKPMLAETAEEPFEGQGWLFEIKWDGYRAIAEIEKGNVDLYSRNGKKFNGLFPPVVSALATIPHTAVLDGEIVAVDKAGKPDFGLLQNFSRSTSGVLIYYVFDILYCDGYDITRLPLSGRKKILKAILSGAGKAVRFSDHIVHRGMAMYRFAADQGLEGIMAKKEDSVYVPGARSASWRKVKIRKRQEAVIIGYTRPKEGRKWFGSLALGVYDGEGRLRYIGNAGSGFNERELKELYAELSKRRVETPPAAAPFRTALPIVWVLPELVCEVQFTEWTTDGLMRHPVFMGMRVDKEASQVRAEAQTRASAPAWRYLSRADEQEMIEGGRLVKLTHLNKVFWSAHGYTKRDLLEYYLNVSPYILPHIAGRPQSLHRFPDGIDGMSFFHKNAGGDAPSWIKTFPVKDGDETRSYIIVTDTASLMYVVNLGCIDINVWNSGVHHLDKPDYIVFDLDPLDIAFRDVVRAARATHDVLDEIGAKNFCKTSGATGMHIYVPAGPYTFKQAKEFAYLVNLAVNRRLPGITSLERNPAKRRRKVYLDFLQNHAEATMAAPYSVRPRRKAVVSTPLSWDEVVPELDPGRFTLRTIFSRLSKTGDLWKGLHEAPIDMAGCLDKLSRKLNSRKKSEEKRTTL